MDPTDAHLILAARQGDQAAWQTLVERYQRLIYTVPRRAGLDEGHATDVFQRVFTKLVAHLHRIEQPDRVRAWLVTTAKRETLRLLEREKRYASSSRDISEEHSIPDTDPLPEEKIQSLEEANLVQLAVQEVGGKCTALLTLLFYENQDNSYAEIAVQLGIKAGSIGPTRARCLQKVQRLLEKWGYV